MPANDDDREGSEALAFSVDTHLLRELGALLVGRDSTALVELIKNAYDADASRVVVHGESLQDHGSITVNDDGHGMTYIDFVENFLRIAGRSKEGGPRRSPLYGRKFTGAKGIGRLSSHKLGERLTLESTPNLSVLTRTGRDSGFSAVIDWPQIEDSTKSIDKADLIRATHVDSGGPSGTLLSIGRLHSGWSTRQLNQFLSEVRSTRPDDALCSPFPPNVFVGEPLVPRIEISDSGVDDPGFEIEMSGEFAGTETQWPTLLSQTAWAIEIDARDDSLVRYRMTPSRRTVREFEDATQLDFTWSRPEPGAQFVSRIFLRDPRPDKGLRDLLSTFAREAGGVRLFLEGFRVLPYGAPRNDWLGLDRQYTIRGGVDDLLGGVQGAGIARPRGDERTYRLPNTSYFGGVFLKDETSGGLQMVVNREGFLPSEAFDQVADIVARGVNINTRMRAALGAQRQFEERQQISVRRMSSLPSMADSTQRTPGRADDIRSLIEIGRHSASVLRQTPMAESPELQSHVKAVETVLGAVEDASNAVGEEQAQLRVLAGLGTQLGAFVHEVNGVLGQANTIRDALDLLIASPDFQGMAKISRVRLRSIRRAQQELITGLERQAIYLSDSLGAEARRRRSRQKISERWETAARLLGTAAERREVDVVNSVPSDVRSPPMFAAELNVILTNLLSNAIKAVSRQPGGIGERTVRAFASRDLGRVVVRVENTGDPVVLRDSERWFRPFETTTSDIDEALGQGLGLGLPLTRRIIEEYGGEIHFVEPSTSMSTCVEFWLPDN